MLHEIAGNHVYSTSGQFMVILLVGLLESGVGSKQEVLARIRSNRWFDLRPEDLQSYLAQNGGEEPRWENRIAWARAHLARFDYLCAPNIHDHWQLNMGGRDLATRVKAEFWKQAFQVRYCYLFSPEFKKHLDPQWQHSDKDIPRPANMYRDWRTIEALAVKPQLDLFQ